MESGKELYFIRRILIFVSLLVFGLTGCAAQEASGEAVRRLNDDPIDCAGATELTVF